jgi:simple sugar transport system permease protein
MRLKIVKRHTPLGLSFAVIFVAAVLLALVFCGLLLALQEKSAWQGLLVFLSSGFGSFWALEDTLNKAIPIFLCSLGVAVAFRLKIWNIGAEGQYALGAIGATWVALSFPGLPWYLLLPAMLLAASLTGGLWGLIPALLKVHLQANEIITTLMLNYIGIRLLEFLVYGVWQDPASFGFPMTPQFSEAAIVGRIPGTNLHWGLALCGLIGLAMAVFLQYSRLGFELKAGGENVKTARYARIPYEKLILVSLVMSGALAGWAGFLETSATLNRLQPSIMAGYGYTAIVVAWLANLNPVGIGVFSLLLASMHVGVEGLQLELQVPEAFGSIVEGLILLTILCAQFFKHYRFRIFFRPQP